LAPPRWLGALDFNGNVAFQRRFDPAGFHRTVATVASDFGFAILGSTNGAFGDETILIKTDLFGQSGCDYGTPTSLTTGSPVGTVTPIAGATIDASATVVSSTLATRVTVTSNIVQICPVP